MRVASTPNIVTLAVHHLPRSLSRMQAFLSHLCRAEDPWPRIDAVCCLIFSSPLDFRVTELLVLPSEDISRSDVVKVFEFALI